MGSRDLVFQDIFGSDQDRRPSPSPHHLHAHNSYPHQPQHAAYAQAQAQLHANYAHHAQQLPNHLHMTPSYLAPASAQPGYGFAPDPALSRRISTASTNSGGNYSMYSHGSGNSGSTGTTGGNGSGGSSNMGLGVGPASYYSGDTTPLASAQTHGSGGQGFFPAGAGGQRASVYHTPSEGFSDGHSDSSGHGGSGAAGIGSSAAQPAPAGYYPSWTPQQPPSYYGAASAVTPTAGPSAASTTAQAGPSNPRASVYSVFGGPGFPPPQQVQQSLARMSLSTGPSETYHDDADSPQSPTFSFTQHPSASPAPSSSSSSHHPHPQGPRQPYPRVSTAGRPPQLPSFGFDAGEGDEGYAYQDGVSPTRSPGGSDSPGAAGEGNGNLSGSELAYAVGQYQGNGSPALAQHQDFQGFASGPTMFLPYGDASPQRYASPANYDHRPNSMESDRASNFVSTPNSSIHAGDGRHPSLTLSMTPSNGYHPYGGQHPYAHQPSSASSSVGPGMPYASNASLAARRSAESVRVYPTQPRPTSVYNDRSFSFSGTEKPDLRMTYGYPPGAAGGGTARSSVSSGLSRPPPVPGGGTGSTGSGGGANVVASRRTPIVYPALLSRVADAFKTRITLSERFKDGLWYPDAFDGREAVDRITYIIKTTDRNLALLLGRALDAQKFFHDVTYDHRLRDSPNELYQFRERLFRDDEEGTERGDEGLPGISEVGEGYENEKGKRRERRGPPSITDTTLSDDYSMPSGVFTLLTDCYSPTCTRDRLCYSIACPRRLEQQSRLNMQPKPGLARTISQESLGDVKEPGTLWIHSVPPEVAEKVSDQEKKRQEAINELIYTEREFVKDIEYLREFWIKPLTSSKIIEPPERLADFLQQVFWNILDIHAVNQRFSAELTKRQKASHVVEEIGDIFLDTIPKFDPFVHYGAHQLYGKYEFEKEKGTNPAFAKFVDETERKPESRKLELNGYLTKPTTRLARYPLLLEAVNKYTPEDNPDKKDLQTAIGLIRGFLSRVNVESGKSENRFNLAQLDQQLHFKTTEIVDLELRKEGREILFKSILKKRGGTQSESADLQVILFDHALLMVKQRNSNKHGELKVYRKPIPLEFLTVSVQDDPPANAKTNTVRPRALMSRQSSVKPLPPPQQVSKNGYPITFTHLGRKAYTITLWSPTWANRKKWLEKIEGQQGMLTTRTNIFDFYTISEGFFANTNRITCVAPYESGTVLFYGTNNGVYMEELRRKGKAPIKVISTTNVTQIEVLEESGILLTLADKALQAYAIDQLDPNDAVGIAKRARKYSTNATFFRAGICMSRMLICVVKTGPQSSTIKILEPAEQHNRGKKQPAFRKLLQGGGEHLKLFREFYVGSESTSVHFLKHKLCIGTTKGFDVVDLGTLDIQCLLDPEDHTLDFAHNRTEGVRPLAIFRVDSDFLLCYSDFAFYVNKNGWRAKNNWMVQWEGHPTSFALRLPYILAFEPTFIEVREAYSGALVQVVKCPLPPSALNCRYTDNPHCTAAGSHNNGYFNSMAPIYAQHSSNIPSIQAPRAGSAPGYGGIIFNVDDKLMILKRTADNA